MTNNQNDEFTNWLGNRSDEIQRWFRIEGNKNFKLWFIQNNIYSTWSEDLAAQQLKSYYRCLKLVWNKGIDLISTAVPENLRRDKLIVLTAVGNNGLALQYYVTDATRRGDKHIVLTAVGNNGLALQYVTDATLRGDKHIVLTAVGNNGLALQYVPENLRGDRDIVLAAVGNNGLALQYVTDATLRRDRDIVLAAVGNDGNALHYVPEYLNLDDEVLNAAGIKALAEAYKRSQRKNYLVLTVFQSSPLVIESSRPEDKNPFPLDVLDFQEEENDLQEALANTELQLQFKVATERNLNLLIPTGNISMLHFSGHGNKECIYFEHPNGSGHKINVQDLKELIDEGGKKLKFAFIAACESRLVEQAFVDAGVEHVICMERDDQSIHDDDARTFAFYFYNALAKDKTIQEAFDQAGRSSNSRGEVAKFALLPEGNDGHDITLKVLFPEGNSNSCASARPPPSLLPNPPKCFLQREVEMYKVIKSMMDHGRGGNGERLVRVTGKRGIGKESFCAAVGRYMEKRRMLGEVYWVSCQEYEQIRESIEKLIEGLLVDEQAVVIINSKNFEGMKLMLLSRFLHDLISRTYGVKFLVFHWKEHQPEPPDNEKGWQEIVLDNLNLKEAVYLFGNNCNFAKNTPSRSWSDKYMVERCDQYFETVKDIFLCDGIPQRIIQKARHMEEFDYNKFVGHIALSDFPASDLSTNEQGSEETSFDRDIGDGSSRTPPPPLKTQDEIRDKFVGILQGNGRRYRKSTTSYIRKAIKGETVITKLEDEVEETQVEVTDDNSMVVRSKSTAGEEYVLTRNKFLKYYDETSSKEIPGEDNFREYKSKKRLVRAKQVEPTDIAWFRGGDSSSDSANYLAPWGTKDRIKTGDYLVMPQHELNAGDKVELYRISKDVFNETYVEELATIANEDSGTKTGVSEDLRTDMESKKTEGRIAVYQPFGILQAFQLLGSKISSATALLFAAAVPSAVGTAVPPNGSRHASKDRLKRKIEDVDYCIKMSDSPTQKQRFCDMKTRLLNNYFEYIELDDDAYEDADE